MFRCYFCQQVTPPKTTRHNVVIEIREKQYAKRRREPKRGGFRSREDDVQDRGGKGTEITREVDACPACAAKHHEVIRTTVAPPAPPEGQENTEGSDSQVTESHA